MLVHSNLCETHYHMQTLNFKLVIQLNKSQKSFTIFKNCYIKSKLSFYLLYHRISHKSYAIDKRTNIIKSTSQYRKRDNSRKLNRNIINIHETFFEI